VLLLGYCSSRRVGVASVQQALQHDPAIVDVAIVGEVDPAHAPVGKATDHLVLATDQRTRLQLRVEVERSTTFRTEPFRPSRHTLSRSTDRCSANRTKALVF